jgi:hypothetical protein
LGHKGLSLLKKAANTLLHKMNGNTKIYVRDVGKQKEVFKTALMKVERNMVKEYISSLLCRSIL